MVKTLKTERQGDELDMNLRDNSKSAFHVYLLEARPCTEPHISIPCCAQSSLHLYMSILLKQLRSRDVKYPILEGRVAAHLDSGPELLALWSRLFLLSFFVLSWLPCCILVWICHDENMSKTCKCYKIPMDNWVPLHHEH